MLWEQSQCLVHHGETLLEFAALIMEVGHIEYGFEEIVCRLLGLQEVVLRLLDISFAQFENAQVIERLSMG